MAERVRDLVFSEAGPAGVVRAAYTPDDAWSVSLTAFEHRVTCLAAGAKGSTVVYAGTDGGGAARSNDAGVTWKAAGLAGVQLRSLAVSPHSPIGGESWRELDGFRAARRWYWFSPAEPSDLRAYVQSIGVSPTDPAVLLAGIEAGAVLLSLDGGETWTGHRRRADRLARRRDGPPNQPSWLREGR